MRDKKFLFLSDESITILHKENKKTFFFKEGIEQAKKNIREYLSLSPRMILYCLIDRVHQDIREEKLPPLFFWDRIRLLSHKQKAWCSHGKFYGYRLLKQQNGETYLQWVSISENDPLTSWIEWIHSLPNPKRGVFFIPLEAGKFLKQHTPQSATYRVFLYKFHSHETRHAIFKEERLLLLRPLLGAKDLQASLHFLSRTYPAIHENLHVVSQDPDQILRNFTDISLINQEAFIDFVISQNTPSLLLRAKKPPLRFSKQHLTFFFTVILLFATGFCCYQGIQHRKESTAIAVQTDKLKLQIKEQPPTVNEQNSKTLQSTLDHYRYLKTMDKNPLKKIEILEKALKKHGIHLEEFVWNNEGQNAIEIGFVMPRNKAQRMVNQLHTLLETLSQAFPHSQLQTIEAPFKSAFHETYQFPESSPLPTVRLRIVWL